MLDLALSIVSLATSVGGVVVVIWKWGESKAQLDYRVQRNLERIKELEDSVRELDLLKSLPTTISHMSTQVDRIASIIADLTTQVQGLKTVSELKSQLLQLLDDARKDHEARIRRIENSK